MPRTKAGIYGSPVSHSASPFIFNNYIWKALGLEGQGYDFQAYDCPSTDDPACIWRRNMQNPDHIGSSVTMPIKLSVIPYLDELTPEAQAVGSVNTTKIVEKNGKLIQIGTNFDLKAIRNRLRQALTGTPSPFHDSVPSEFQEGRAAAFVIGGGGATRAAIYALHLMKLSPIYILNRDAAETEAMIKQFPQVDLRKLTSADQVKSELKKLEADNTRLCHGVGCIPSIEPETESEKMVYEVARALFSYPYASTSKETEGGSYFTIPDQPLFLDMAYKPNMTLLRTMAEELGWGTGSGVDMVAESCFEQAEWWLGLSVPAKDREAIRQVIRERL